MIASIIIIVSQIIGGLMQIGSPLFYVGRQIAIMIWSYRKMWPIRISRVKGKQPIIRHKGFSISVEPRPPIVRELYVKCSVRIKVKDKKAQSKIRDAQIELTTNGKSWVGKEAISSDTPRIMNRKLNEIPEDIYDIDFCVPVDDYLKDWYNGDLTADIYAKIKLTIIEKTCETDLGLLRKIGSHV